MYIDSVKLHGNRSFYQLQREGLPAFKSAGLLIFTYILLHYEEAKLDLQATMNEIMPQILKPTNTERKIRIRGYAKEIK